VLLGGAAIGQHAGGGMTTQLQPALLHRDAHLPFSACPSVSHAFSSEHVVARCHPLSKASVCCVRAYRAKSVPACAYQLPRYNLLRDDSEGYAKLVVALNHVGEAALGPGAVQPLYAEIQVLWRRCGARGVIGDTDIVCCTC
jgi:hypothetical protein